VSTFGERIKEARLAKGFSQAELARLVGMSQATVAQMELGRNNSSGKVALLAAVLDVGPVWLTSGRGPREAGAPTGERAGVPLYEWGDVHRLDDASPVAHVTTFVRVSPVAFALKVVGDAMEPDLPRGSVVVVDPNEQAQSGHFVVVVAKDGAAMLRQYTVEGSSAFLRPSNGRYPVERMPPDSRIAGRVVALQAAL
jgi:SOS-response transcriptional repressor LexA